MRACLAGALAFTAAALFGALPARAQAVPGGGLALDQLDPAPAGDTFFGLPSPSTSGHLVPRALVMFDYASRPMVVTTNGTSRPIVSGQGFLHLNASLALFDRVLVSLLFPIAVMQSGESPEVNGIPFVSPSSVEVGDLRLGARVGLFGEDSARLKASAGASLYFPTGPSARFVGDGAVRLSPALALGGRLSLFTWSASIGVMFRSSKNPSTLTYGAGVSASLLSDRLEVGPEVFVATPLQDGFIELDDQRALPRGKASNAELLFGARGRLLGSLVVGAAVGPGLSSAVGTPAFRVLGTVGFSPLASPQRSGDPKPFDTDEDGIADPADACPYAFGPPSADRLQHGCPVHDRDGDGVPDPADACPDDRGDAGDDPKRRGCPPDGDGDGVPDGIDACPDQKGSAEANGCLAR
jgi:hypothetical protein